MRLAFSSCAIGRHRQLEPPGNDNFLDPIALNSPGTPLNATDTLQNITDTIGASLQPNIFDPCNTSSCPSGPPEASTCQDVPYGKTVWYDFYPDHNGQVEIRAKGIRNVIALYSFDPRTRVPHWLQCSSGSNYPTNVLHADVQRGVDYAFQIGGRNGAPGSLKVLFNFVYGKALTVAPFLTAAVLQPIGHGDANLLRFKLIGLTRGESGSAACAFCSSSTFRSVERRGDVVALRARPPSTFSSRTRFIVVATARAQIGRFKLYGLDTRNWSLSVIAAGCLPPGVTSVGPTTVKDISLLNQVSVSCPMRAVNSTGGEYVFWVNTAGRLWEKRFTRGAWRPGRRGNATKLGSSPAVAVHANGEQDVFWKGRTDSLWESWYTSKWFGPQQLELGPAQLESAPAAGVDAAGDEYVFLQGTDGELWENSFAGGGWSLPIKLDSAGKIDSAPAVAVHASGEQDVFWRGTYGNLWEMWYTNRWNGPVDLGGELASVPTVGVDAAGDEYVFWQGTDGGLWEKLYTNGVWGHAFELPTSAGSARHHRWPSTRTDSRTSSTGARTASCGRRGTRPSGTGRQTSVEDTSARHRPPASMPPTNSPLRNWEAQVIRSATGQHPIPFETRTPPQTPA